MDCKDGRPSQKNPIDCCPIPQMIQKKVFEDCEKANPDKKSDHPEEKGLCLSECVLNTTKINVNNVISKEMARKTLFSTDPSWKDVMSKSLEKCLNEGFF